MFLERLILYFYKNYHRILVARYKELFLQYLEEQTFTQDPENLYKPINYILDLGGKRMRPVLTLMVCDVFGGEVANALDAAMAVEVFHNFTLIHDDIMDSAPLRRGKPTVHQKWDVNTGILSGDAMMILAFRFLENYEGAKYSALLRLLNKTALEVCEGQQYDIDFETRQDVTIEEYLHMIKLKTSVLVAAAMKMGAVVAEASESDAELMYQFGLNLGLAFQLQDDYLDTYGDPVTFGKQVGGDIIENKKTFLVLKSLELGTADDSEKLRLLLSEKYVDVDKVEKVKHLFNNSGAPKEILKEIENYTQKALQMLEAMNLPPVKKELLKKFGEDLMRRTV